MALVNSAAGYHYVAEGHHYLLDPEVTIGLTRIRLTGCGIYTMDLEYLGYWDVFNMPLDLIRSMVAWYKRERSGEITMRRTKLAAQKRSQF